MIYVIEFAPPMSGFYGTFNTFRLGGAWAKKLKGGERVLLTDKKLSAIIGPATVESVITGKLRDLAEEHAFRNHNYREFEKKDAADRLISGSIKRYGPQKVNDNSVYTVIYLRFGDEGKSYNDLHRWGTDVRTL